MPMESTKRALYSRDSILDIAFLFSDTYIRHLFIRGVLIKDFRFKSLIMPTIFDVVEVFININSRTFIPNISRNNIDSNQMDKLNYIVSKAINIAASNVLNLSLDEKALHLKFIQEFYPDKTLFEKI